MSNIRTLINENVSGATFISITTSTTPALTGGKKNPHKGFVKKITTDSNVMIFQNKSINGYEAMVKRRLVSEGKDPSSFTLGDRAWGSRVTGTPFIEHNGEYYLEVIFLKAGESHYELDGTTIAARFVNGVPHRRDYDGQGGLNDKVIIRTFKISSITSITIAGDTYTDLEYK